MMLSNAWPENKKYILLNNFGSKQSVNEIWPVYVILQKEIFYQKIYKNCDLKTNSRAFCVCKELSPTSVGK